MASLGLQANSKPSSTNSHFPKNERSKKSTGKRKHAAPVEGARKSARLRDQPAQHASAEFNDDNETSATHPQSIPPAIRKLDPIALPEPSDLEDYDPNYRAPFPSRHDNGIFSFQDGYEHFAPNLSPREIFQASTVALQGIYWVSETERRKARLVAGFGATPIQKRFESHCRRKTKMSTRPSGGKTSTSACLRQTSMTLRRTHTASRLDNRWLNGKLLGGSGALG